jgi:hypothetical protein
VQVSDEFTLDDLHHVIQSVFEWEDDHLYEFLVTAGGKVTRRAMIEAVRYAGPVPGGPYDDDEPGKHPASDAVIGRIFTDECKQIVYEYDFGDSWTHLVKLEKRKPSPDEDHIPVCVAGENAAPREDMGGMSGFYSYLEALHSPDSEANEAAQYFLGDDFDPAAFDLAEANKRLKALFKPARRKPRKKKE